MIHRTASSWLRAATPLRGGCGGAIRYRAGKSPRNQCRRSALRIGPYLLASLLFGFVATHAAQAQEATPRAYHSGRSNQSTGQGTSGPISGHHDAPVAPRISNRPRETNAGSKTPSSEMQGVKEHGLTTAPNGAGIRERRGKQGNPISAVAGPRSGDVKGPSNDEAIGRDSNSVETRARDANPIDTRITVQPRRPSKNPEKLRDLKTVSKPIVPRGIAVRRGIAPAAGGHVTRNAIGAAIVRHENVGPGSGEPNGSRLPLPAAESTVSIANANAGLEHRIVPLSNPHLTVTPAVVNRGRIDGSALTRPRFAPANVGGPARMVVGINGTTFRPKH
jgi:hypothetical protein